MPVVQEQQPKSGEPVKLLPQVVAAAEPRLVVQVAVAVAVLVEEVPRN